MLVRKWALSVCLVDMTPSKSFPTDGLQFIVDKLCQIAFL